MAWFHHTTPLARKKTKKKPASKAKKVNPGGRIKKPTPRVNPGGPMKAPPRVNPGGPMKAPPPKRAPAPRTGSGQPAWAY